MAKHMTVMATWLVSVLEQLVAQGMDRDQLTDGLWRAEAAQAIPTRQLELTMVRRLWHRAAALSGDPLLGLKVGAALPLQAMNIIAILVMHSANLREAIAHTVRCQQLVSNSGQLSASARRGGLLLRYAVTPCPVAMHHTQIESLFAGWLNLVRHCSALPRLHPHSMALTSPHTALKGAYAEHFGCPVACSAASAMLDFDDETLDTPFHGADPSLLALARDHAGAMLRAQNQAESLTASIRASVAACGFTGVSCDVVALQLGISTRTLQRRLTDSKTSFRRLVEDTRMDEAIRLLCGTKLPLSALSDQLGYSEPSAFAHAVKAYWGATPRELRNGSLPIG